MNTLKGKRLKVGLTQIQVAVSLGVRQSSISMWETGDAHPRADKLPALAALYHCTIDELLREYTDNESITGEEAG